VTNRSINIKLVALALVVLAVSLALGSLFYGCGRAGAESPGKAAEGMTTVEATVEM